MNIPSEPTDTEKRMCRNKSIFKTLLDAYGFIEKRKVQGKPLKESIRPYKCPFCKKYHLSSKEKYISESNPDYLVKVLNRQGFGGDFADRFVKKLINS